MKREIAFFDFDGTITTKDTLLEFIKFAKGQAAFYLGFLIHAPFLVGFKLKLISNQLAKEKVLQHFFKGMPLDEFNRLCHEFSVKKLGSYIRPGALEEIKMLKENGMQVVVVSASPENWIREWADQVEVILLASKLEVLEGHVTGKILGKNCHGDEKVRRIREHFNLKDFTVVAAYGDSKGDLPMLRLADKPHFKPFRRS